MAKKTGKPAKLVELIMRNAKIVGVIPIFSLINKGVVDARVLFDDVEMAKAVLERDKSLLVTLVGKSLYTDAGIDFSNAPMGYAVLPPENPKESARRIRERGIFTEEQNTVDVRLWHMKFAVKLHAFPIEVNKILLLC